MRTAAKDKPDIQLTLDLTEDPADNHDNDQLYCLYNICGMVNNIGAAREYIKKHNITKEMQNVD